MDLVDIDSYMLHLVIVYIAIGFIEIVLQSSLANMIFHLSSPKHNAIKTKHYLASYPNETQYKK